MKPQFSDEEERIVRQLAQSGSWWFLFGYYVAFLVPMIAFIAYGLFSNQPVATVFGVLGILGGVIWRISQEWKYAKVYESIFKKVLAANEPGRNG